MVKGLHHHNLCFIFLSIEAAASNSDSTQAEDEGPILTPGLLSAFKFAEFVRRELVRGHHWDRVNATQVSVHPHAI